MASGFAVRGIASQHLKFINLAAAAMLLTERSEIAKQNVLAHRFQEALARHGCNKKNK